MSIHSVRILINPFIKRPYTHFRLFTASSCRFNNSIKSFKYQRQLTKREANLYKQFTKRHMAKPMNDENIEKLLEPFRAAVKIQVKPEMIQKSHALCSCFL